MNNEAPKWMWGKQEVFVFSESSFVLMGDGKDPYVAEESSEAAKWQLVNPPGEVSAHWSVCSLLSVRYTIISVLDTDY